MAELLLQSVTECGVPLQYSLLPPLPTPEALREYDQALADSMQAISLPPKWSLLGSNQRSMYNVYTCTDMNRVVLCCACLCKTELVGIFVLRLYLLMKCILVVLDTHSFASQAMHM